jgi:hypothetical protein
MPNGPPERRLKLFVEKRSRLQEKGKEWRNVEVSRE